MTNSAEHYYYMGGNVGGPILIPFTDFNKSRKKLFFWAGYEYMNQHPAATPINYNVPTAEQLGGDFSENTINGQPGTIPSRVAAAIATLELPFQQSVWQYAYSSPYGLPDRHERRCQPRFRPEHRRHRRT